MRRTALPMWSVVLTTAALALWFGMGPAPQALVFERDAIAAGQWWRLLTGHWVHSDADHALWNISALAFLTLLFEPRLRLRLPAALLIGMAAVDGWLWWGMSRLQCYCGLSGLLNTLLAAGLLALWRDTHDRLVLLVGAGAVLKIVAETALGQALFSSTAWASVPTAHAVGFTAGLIGEFALSGGRESVAPTAPLRPKLSSDRGAAGALLAAFRVLLPLGPPGPRSTGAVGAARRL